MKMSAYITRNTRIEFPRSLGEAKTIIADTFAFNKWNDAEQRRYLKMRGFDKDLNELNLYETRAIISDLARLGMVLFKL